MRADKGFGNLLKQEIANIGAENVGVLSPAICPDCPSGSSADNDLSQRQLYERMDLVCAAGITDFSVFTFFEVAQRRQHRQLGRTLAERYAEEPFLQVLPFGETPSTRHIRGSNFCHLGVVGDRIEGRAIVVAALDNLTKGSSGQALQNANLMLDLPETEGLMMAPLFP